MASCSSRVGQTPPPVLPGHKMKYWKINKIDQPYAWIFCPKMDEKLDFGLMRKIYKEFKQLEKRLKFEYKGWVACTKLEHRHVMNFMEKMDAKVVEYNSGEMKVWYRKEL
jgi:hypothetical protein